MGTNSCRTTCSHCTQNPIVYFLPSSSFHSALLLPHPLFPSSSSSSFFFFLFSSSLFPPPPLPFSSSSSSWGDPVWMKGRWNLVTSQRTSSEPSTYLQAVCPCKHKVHKTQARGSTMNTKILYSCAVLWRCSSVCRASDRHAADASSIPQCGKEFFSQSTFSADSLTAFVHPRVLSHAFTSVRTLKIP